MKTITTYQLEAGDVLYYVHKPDDQYVVDEIVLDESNFVKDVIKHSISEKLSIKLPNKHDNSDFYYIRTNIEQPNQPLMLYTSITTLSGVYGFKVLDVREKLELELKINNSEINQNTNKNKYSSIISRKTESRIPIIHTNFRLTLIIMLMTTISSNYHTMDSAWQVICIPMSMKKIGNHVSPITKNSKTRNNRKENPYVSLY